MEHHGPHPLGINFEMESMALLYNLKLTIHSCSPRERTSLNSEGIYYWPASVGKWHPSKQSAV